MKADDPRRYPQFTRAELANEINSLDRRIVQMQKAKQRDKLPQMQSELHAMRMEAKRREVAAKRELWNAPA